MTVEILVAAVAVVGAVTVAVLPLWAAVRERRRQRYAEAARTLVAWSEYPFRIARRTSDSEAELARLTALGHQLQEAVVEHQAWLSVDSRRLGDLYQSLIQELRSWTSDAARQAWTRAPITTGAEMNIDPLGPDVPDLHKLVRRFTEATRYRFGLKRLFAWRISKR